MGRSSQGRFRWDSGHSSQGCTQAPLFEGIRRFSQNGKIVNYDLEKALKRSFLKAQQQIASECHKELIEPSRRASKGLVIYLPQDRPYLEWLKKKIKQLKSELKQVNK
jgi:hypothetical protein